MKMKKELDTINVVVFHKKGLRLKLRSFKDNNYGNKQAKKLFVKECKKNITGFKNFSKKQIRYSVFSKYQYDDSSSVSLIYSNDKERDRT